MLVRSAVGGIATLLVLSAASMAPAAQVMYALGDNGTSLLRLSSDNPAGATRVGFFGGAGSALDSIDFRPATGQLYGYSDSLDSYFVVDVTTGQLSTASAPAVGATTNTLALGIDWNPTIDRLRVVTETDQNIVFNPGPGTATSATTLAYVPGDPNVGVNPSIVENAYTKNIAGLGQPTQQYVLDHALNILATLGNNAGTLATVAALSLGGNALDFDDFVGFDIFTASGGLDTAYAILNVGGVSGLYTINLSDGTTTSLGSLSSTFGPVYGLAVAAVPEPSTLALGIVGLAGSVLFARRRRQPRG